MKTQKSVKKEMTPQDFLDILNYYAQALQIPMQKFTLKDSNFGDFYKKFQIYLIKYLQDKTRGSQEHENALELLKICTRLLNSFLSSGFDKTSPSAQVEKEWEELLTKKISSRSSRTKEKVDSLEFGQKYALVQKGAEGNFFFTSAVSRYINDYNVDTSAAKIKIEPSRGLEKDKLAKLGSVAGSSVLKAQARKIRKGLKIYSAEFPEYGAFHSFAPSVDLGRANLSRIDSIAVRYRGRKVFIEKGLDTPKFPVKIYNGEMDSSLPQMISLPTDEELETLTKDRSEDATDLADVDFGFLEKMGINVDDLLKKEDDMDVDETDESTLFGKNVDLIRKLIGFQDDRIRKGAEDVSSAELEVATSLKTNLAKIVSAFSPKDVVTVHQVREAMKYVKKTEKAYRGGLPQQAPFVFPCNTAGNGVIPPGSGTVPLALLR